MGKFTVYSFQFSVLIAFFLLFLLSPITLNSKPVFGQNCQPNALNPRAQGLITTNQIIPGSIFGNPTGQCVNAPAAVFTKLPSYATLKSLYYTQSKAAKQTISVMPSSITSPTIYTTPSNTNLTVSSIPTGSSVAVIFVEGNLNINTNYTYGSSAGSAGTIFIVKGDINIDSSAVNQVDAVLISFGTICTASVNQSCPAGSVNANQLVVNGSLISLNPDTAAPHISFRRNYQVQNQPAEVVNQQPKYNIILKDLFSSPLQKWSEVTKLANIPTAIPKCNSGATLCGSCSATTPNTCSNNNGTQTCTYTTYTGGGTCVITSGSQACTVNACQSGYQCNSGSCIPFCNSGISCGICSAQSNTCSNNNGTQTCTYTTYSGGGSCIVIPAPTQACTIDLCISGYKCTSGSCINQDEDGDGYQKGPINTTCPNSKPCDCYDAAGGTTGYCDNSPSGSGADTHTLSYCAHPGQTYWFDQDRGDGSFDYNCDGSSTHQWTAYHNLNPSGYDSSCSIPIYTANVESTGCGNNTDEGNSDFTTEPIVSRDLYGIVSCGKSCSVCNVIYNSAPTVLDPGTYIFSSFRMACR